MSNLPSFSFLSRDREGNRNSVPKREDDSLSRGSDIVLARPFRTAEEDHDSILLRRDLDAFADSSSSPAHGRGVHPRLSGAMLEALPACSIPASSYSLRSRGAQPNKLVYDLKYHPMDDNLRPSQAAKRRLAHGEQQPSLDDSRECSSGQSEANSQSRSDSSAEEEEEEEGKRRRRIPPKQAKTDRKRGREQSPSWQPMRRSPRQTSDAKKLYNMKVHPQDKELGLLYSDEKVGSPSVSKRRKFSRTNGQQNLDQKGISSDSASTTFTQDNTTMIKDCSDETLETSPESDTIVYNPEVKKSPISPTSIPHLHGIRRKKSLDISKLATSNRHFCHDRDSWPFVPGQPFSIWEEQWDSQVAKDAMDAFPVNFEHEDKENEHAHSGHEQDHDPLEGISVTPISQYRRTEQEVSRPQYSQYLSDAFYGSDAELNVYGLDGAHKQDTDGAGPDINVMRLLATGAHLPRT